MNALDHKKLANFFNALSHPTRTMIVVELLRDKKCVNDIEKLTKMKQPNISQHLSILKTSNIVDCTQQGKRKCYFLKDRRLIKSIIGVLEKYDEQY